ncbi:MAG: alpha/beta fold hydrolase [Planctomycetota bacterium]|mgnify:FL=1
MAKVELNGITMHYQMKGEGPDVVLIHGVTSSLAVWFTHIMPELAKDFRVTAYDLRGHGYSGATRNGYTSLDTARDLLALLDHLGIQKARLVGHSFGGSVALHFALLHPDRVEGVVLGDTGVACLRHLRTIQDWPGWELHKDRIANYGITYEWFVEAEASDVRNVIRRSYDMTQPYGARRGAKVGTPRMRKLVDETNVTAEFRQVAGMTEDLLPTIQSPVFAVYGANSPYAKMAARLADALPNCRAKLLPDTGHFYLLEHVDVFLEHITEFLRDPSGFIGSIPRTNSAAAATSLNDAAASSKGNGSSLPRQPTTVSPAPPTGRADSPRPDRSHPEGGKPMSRILLVQPKFDSEFAKARQFAKASMDGEAVQTLMTPLNLATIAALTPDDFDVDIWDEGAKGEIDDATDLGKEYHLVGVTGYIAHVPRAIKIAEVFHRRGLPVVIGGPGASGAPELCRGVFDVIFLGEAELTWPRFLEEWKQGGHRNEYRQVERPDLATSPLPDWSSMADLVKKYRVAGVQTTRGCPYDCEFCDVIHLFGRQPRHKPIARVVEEVVALQKLGAQRIFVCDDDFIGDKRYAKEFLRALIPVNNSFDPPLTFSTQLTIDLAHDDELLELMADCNFTQALIGIETPRMASLEETHKVQNLRSDMVEDCRKIQSYGIAVKASLIVGFDNDDTKVFDEQIRFCEVANIPITSINVMKAYPGTPLWVRLQREDRVVDVSEIYTDAPKCVSNIIPKGMTRVELLEGYRRLITELRSWPSFARRMKAFLSGIKRKPNVAAPSPAVRAQRMERMMKARGALDSVPKEARDAVTEILMHAMQTTPYLIEHVGILLLQQAMDNALIPAHGDVIQRQIDQTASGALRLAPDPSAGMIPATFRTAVREVLPTLHDRLSAEIHYQPGVPEAMVAVIKDFLIRWGPTFERFEDYHQVYLQELCDRHVARFNGDNRNGRITNGKALTREHTQTSKFVTAVLVAVEQEMRGEARSMLEPEPIRITVRGDATTTSA